MAETMTKSTLKPSQEMDRLVQVLDGRWDMAVTYQPSETAPQGGTFTGHEISRRGPGGFSVLVESTSQGPAGSFEGFGTIHWSTDERAYKLHWFTNLSSAPAVFTGRWEGSTLIFNGTETMMGQALASRHSITNIKSDSFHYIIDMGPTSAQLKTVITIDYTRAKR